MTLLTGLALLVGLLVAAPIAAHLLRRRQAEEQPFPAAHLVPPTPPQARRRSALEDRALFGVRAMAVLLLAVLGATPFVKCSRLALSRQGGASVAIAIVLDDSLSMRAPVGADAAGPSRFERAMSGARELTGGARSGDAIAVVLAGAPARVALASTTNMAAVEQALAGVVPSDRATDLDDAIRLAKELLKGLPQLDKRVVVLSDLADGAPEAAPLGEGSDIPTWVPLADLPGARQDCAVTRADRAAAKVHVRVVCAPLTAEADAVASAAAPRAVAAAGRVLEIRDGERALAKAPLAATGRVTDVTLDVPADAPERLRAVLTGSDAIAADDDTPVIAAGGSVAIAVVVDAASSHVETGGPPPIEQAFSALDLDVQVRPLPSIPEHAEELDAFAALIVDDAPGFTPELRRSLAAWVERGGVVLLTLGPRAAAAPLGASFDPLVPGVVRWGASPAPGIDPASAPTLGAGAAGFEDLAPKGRATLDPAAVSGADVLAKWRDGAPLLLRRTIGRGAVVAVTLPLGTDESDLVLRPGFLTLLDRFVGTARARGGARRIEAGEGWTFDGFKQVAVRKLAGPGSPAAVVPVSEADGRPRATTALAGLYEVDLGAEKVLRVAGVPEREIDLRPRRVLDAARSESFGGVAPSVDASPYVALGLLGLLVAELLLRTLGGRGRPAAPTDAPAVAGEGSGSGGG